MKVWILGTGSSGNAVLIEGDGTRVLVDAGFGPRTLAARLKAASVDPASIDACLLTHDHSDHISGVARAAKRWGWAVFATSRPFGEDARNPGKRDQEPPLWAERVCNF